MKSLFLCLNSKGIEISGRFIFVDVKRFHVGLVDGPVFIWILGLFFYTFSGFIITNHAKLRFYILNIKVQFR